MKKTLLLLVLWSLSGSLYSRQNPLEVLSGSVYSSEGFPLPGAFVSLESTEYRAVTDEEGNFQLSAPAGDYVLIVTYIGMETFREAISLPTSTKPRIILKPEEFSLESVDVVSTGYQTLPKERATGSFVLLDSQLVQRRVGPGILERLEDVTPGLIFNKGPQAANDPISIRGRGTIFSNTAPLIIVDNFPYDGPIENINPNDVVSISVLKDAAAASIWGARAGNGVIVISTQRARMKQPLSVSFNSNFTFTEPRDLFYTPQMSIPEFIEIEKLLFGRNFYRSLETNANKPKLSPAVETFIALRDRKITQEEADARIQLYGDSDNRRDIQSYYLQPGFNQQYAISVSGGGEHSAQNFSIGYDKIQSDIIGNSGARWTIATGSQWNFLKDRVKAGVQLNFSNQNNGSTTSLPFGYAYDRLADEKGNPLTIANTYSTRYIESIQGKGLLDWTYTPLKEIRQLDYRTEAYDLRVSPSMQFQVTKGLELGLYYQYWRNLSQSENRDPMSLFTTRDLINRYTQVAQDGTLSYPVPVGEVLSVGNSEAYSHTFRPQLSYQREWLESHFVNVLAGAEVRDLQAENWSTRYYGYRDDMGTSIPVDLVTRYPFYYNKGQQGSILSGNTLGGRIDRFVSYYANLGYDFRHRYFLTASIRKDQANIFGVDANLRGVPLWSAGGGWIVSETFSEAISKMPFVKLRATYGSSGNVDKSLSADVTAQYISFQFFDILPQLRAASIVNPPNPDLRWEKISTSNLALDLETQNGFLAGTVEVYSKKGTDLLGNYSVPASLGLTGFTGNFAETQVKGIDLDLSLRWFRNEFSWTSTFLYSGLKEEVLDFERLPTVSNLLGTAFSPTPQPIVGRPLYGIYTYAWGGLDPQNGNPRGILDGEPSSDYLAISRGATIDNLQYHGPARPTSFGAFRNDFAYRGFSLSLNISYRLGYYYKRRSIDYFTLLRGEIGHGDYDNRWQQPGDEEFTQIPSLPATADTRRNAFYSNSAVLVERGDHIRLNDIRLSYTWDKLSIPNLPFKTLQLYGYAGNLGLIWKASEDALDPDFQTAKPLRSFSAGLKMDF
ncbi:SusC/RagA family TonB-linked outer membrane protein [Algoriphagus lacus]|uniref:SusC/RagA family TonB-linked outer membrane protein n=1 Tax=Algoriphagus lacus TaxID=2056311 RepID=A0A418PNI6_9BACT|nr:SusC/RagA family TonB-linked outer membrane protein [Algoriphagus lacus]RIW13105.1 SusC/RagA family TonB-linked outer membrane protein [Algoriphagus lacus]